MTPLVRAEQIVDELHKMTRAVRLSGAPEMAEAEVEVYTGLISRRQELVDELLQIRESLSLQDINSEGFAKIKQNIADIRKLDAVHLKTVADILSNISHQHRDTKQHQALNRAYAQLGPGVVLGTFDQSK